MRVLLNALAGAVLLLGAATGGASAQWFDKPPPTFGWGHAPPRHVYVPPPVVYVPPPRPIFVAPPRHVYVPPPVIYAPRPVYGWHHRPHWGHRRHW